MADTVRYLMYLLFWMVIKIRTLKRDKTQTRIERKIIYVAFEGEVTEKNYFNFLEEELNEKKSDINLKFKIVDTEYSNPKKIIEEIKTAKVYEENFDKFYLFYDRDRHFKDKVEFEKLINECERMSIEPVVCNRCFELLLILHLVDYTEFDFPELLQSSRENKLGKYLTKLMNKIDPKRSVNVKKHIGVDKIQRKANFKYFFTSNYKKCHLNLLVAKNGIDLESDLLELYDNPGTNALDFYEFLINNIKD